MLVALLKKTGYNTKVREIENNNHNNHNHDKYIAIPEFNTLATEAFNARLARTNQVKKLSSLNERITSNKTKCLLVENELKKLKTFDLSYFIGKSHFEEDG